MMRYLVFAFLACGLVADAAAGTLEPGLAARMDSLKDSDVIKVLVVLHDQRDVSGLDKSLYRDGVGRGERHRVVVQTLQDAAAASQRGLVTTLAAEKADGGIVGFVPHWIVNSVVLTASVAKVREIAARSDVATVEPDLEVVPIEPVSVELLDRRPADKATVLPPGLTAINAQRVWHELGITGAGTIIAGIDSGVDVNHSTLTARWRGRTAPAAECWRDIAGVGSPNLPMDVNGHGTHTMGTMTGAAYGDTLGVAPGALWIATNAIASGADLDNQVLAAFEWLADPDGDPATSDEVPDVVQNSWGIQAGSYGFTACDSRWWDAIDNCEAAGVVVTWSAGNEGPGPYSLRTPPDRASTPTRNFSVGSTRTGEPYQISGFSARGPSRCGGPYAIKPEVVAPGQDILSAYPGNQYAYMSGTSMAGPHVAGVVALMRQARPDLDVDTVKEILMETSRDLGQAGEDNDYGHGIVDAYAAVLMALNEIGTITGQVTDATDGAALDGVAVRDLQGLTTRITGADGRYAFSVRAGQRQYAAELFGYLPTLQTLEIPAGTTLVNDIALVRAPWLRISGHVRDGDSLPVAGAVIAVLDVPVDPLVADAEGYYEVDLPAGEGVAYVLRATAPDLAYDVRHVGLEQDVIVDFDLPTVLGDGFESGGFDAFPYAAAGSAPWVVDDSEAQEGALSARSGAVGHNQRSELVLEYYANGEGVFSFWLMTDSETVYDQLTITVDGAVRGTWTGATPWTQFATELAAGPHTLTWTYRKDDSISLGRDAVWIDAITLPGTGVQPLPDLIVDTAGVTANLAAGTNGAATVALANAGDYRLDFTATVVDAGQPTAAAGWVAVTPGNGVVHPASDLQLVLAFDGSAAPAGTHHAELVLATNDPAAPLLVLPVTLNVAAVSAVGDLPQQVTLYGAVPNPFNPSTEIVFALPASAPVALRVYDVAGRLVRTLVDAALPAGRHAVRWDGRSDADRGSASGVYFVRLQSAGTEHISRMTLVR